MKDIPFLLVAKVDYGHGIFRERQDLILAANEISAVEKYKQFLKNSLPSWQSLVNVSS